MSNAEQRLKSLMCKCTRYPLVHKPLQSITRTRFFPEAIWNRIPIRRTFSVVLDDVSPGFVYASSCADVVGRALFWRGPYGYEHETSETFHRLAIRARVVIDVGANAGFFSLLACASSSASKVVSFEPVPHVFKRLQTHVRLNGWGDRWDVRQQAVSNVSGVVALHVPHGEQPYNASLNTSGFHGVEGNLIDVATTTLDEACGDLEGIDLVKIDVENHEDKVLQGMTGILQKWRPAIVVECIPGGPIKEVESILSSFGYRYFLLGKNGPVQMDEIIPDSSGTFRNYLCTVSETSDYNAKNADA